MGGFVIANFMTSSVRWGTQSQANKLAKLASLFIHFTMASTSNVPAIEEAF